MTATPEPPTVYVVDDDAGVRDALALLLEAGGFAARLHASGEAFLAALPEAAQGCVLLDQSMPGLSGLEVIARLRADRRTLPVIMITAHGEVSLAIDAMKAGAFDFVEKPWEAATLFSAIRRAIARDREQRAIIGNRRQAEALIESLTPRERDVFEELITGASNKVIARRLDISPRTVEFYRAGVLEKTGADGVAGLVRLAFMARRLDPDPDTAERS